MKKFFLLVSTASLVGGVVTLLYLFVLGSTDAALGVVGQYDPKGPRQQGLTFPSPRFFWEALSVTKVDPDLRRLKFQCPDGSESFTLYRTPFGVLGIPDESVVCDDGFKLLTYDPSKGYVIETPKG